MLVERHYFGGVINPKTYLNHKLGFIFFLPLSSLAYKLVNLCFSFLRFHVKWARTEILHKFLIWDSTVPINLKSVLSERLKLAYWWSCIMDRVCAQLQSRLVYLSPTFASVMFASMLESYITGFPAPLSYVRHAQGTPPGFWNGLDCRALVKSRWSNRAQKKPILLIHGR